MITSLPNILTLIRLFIIPSFLMMLYYPYVDSRWLFLLLFSFASLTDFFDGYLARKYSLISTFGRIFDPIADKALVIIICIMVLLKDINLAKIIIFPIIIIILRELIISGLREGLANKDYIIHSSKLGKYKATFQMISLGFLIIGGYENIFYIICLYTGIISLYFSMLLSLASGFQYLQQSYQSLLD